MLAGFLFHNIRWVSGLFLLVDFLIYFDRGVLPGLHQEVINSLLKHETYHRNPELFFGVLQSIFIAGLALSAPVLSHLSIRTERVLQFVAGGLIVWVVSMYGCFIAGHMGALNLLFFFRGLSGVGEAAFATLLTPVLVDAQPPASKGVFLGIFYALMPLGVSCGYVLSSALPLIGLSFPSAFLFIAVLAMAPVAAALEISKLPAAHGASPWKVKADVSKAAPTWQVALPKSPPAWPSPRLDQSPRLDRVYNALGTQRLSATQVATRRPNQTHSGHSGQSPGQSHSGHSMSNGPAMSSNGSIQNDAPPNDVEQDIRASDLRSNGLRSGGLRSRQDSPQARGSTAHERSRSGGARDLGLLLAAEHRRTRTNPGRGSGDPVARTTSYAEADLPWVPDLSSGQDLPGRVALQESLDVNSTDANSTEFAASWRPGDEGVRASWKDSCERLADEKTAVALTARLCDDEEELDSVVGPVTSGSPKSARMNYWLFGCILVAGAAQAAVTATLSAFGTSFLTALEIFSTELKAASAMGGVAVLVGSVGTLAGGYVCQLVLDFHRRTSAVQLICSPALESPDGGQTQRSPNRRSPNRRSPNRTGCVSPCEVSHCAVPSRPVSARAHAHAHDRANDRARARAESAAVEELVRQQTPFACTAIISAFGFFGCVVSLTSPWFLYSDRADLAMLTLAGGLLVVCMVQSSLNLGVMSACAEKERSFGLGLYTLGIHLIGDVPGPILIGFLKDRWAPGCVNPTLTRMICRHERNNLIKLIAFLLSWTNLIWIGGLLGLAAAQRDTTPQCDAIQGGITHVCSKTDERSLHHARNSWSAASRRLKTRPSSIIINVNN
ncbi:major facilitator family transporter [Gregarina niphandrodes]|uniref:Major facilitator family transporter n=1 Tax=Gregarina niphandrodes TaxID=110365 RepID=A0A023AYL7_GRENI|nr:major facilitator family transporter [Gregarina niphandrodes]EZG43762.1 major facilitator family transporter [Gregarina niphandrodes]|eukprot:XP_011134633.1 major facilitator family transporter [Gregarina niphandrodes]